MFIGKSKFSPQVTYYGADMTIFEEVAKANRKKATWYA